MKMRIIIAMLIIFNINFASANNLYTQTNKNQHEFNFENHELSEIKIHFNQKIINPIENKTTIKEEIKTDLIVYKNDFILFKKNFLEFLINKNNKIQIESFSFNSNNDFLKLTIKSNGIGFIELDKLNIKYNDQNLEKDFEIIGSHLIQNKNIFFKDQIELKILKNFKQDSQIEIYYENKKIDEICTIKRQNCNFSNLPKNTIVEKKEDKWIIKNENGSTVLNEPKIKLVKNQNQVLIDIHKNETFEYSLKKILIDNKIQENSKINLDNEFESLEIEIIDNLSNNFKINISEKIKALKKEYRQIKEYQDEIQELNSKLENTEQDQRTNIPSIENSFEVEKSVEKTTIPEEKEVEKFECSNDLKITKLNPNTQEKQEYIFIKNQSQKIINLESCELLDSKENNIQLPAEINGYQEIKISSKNILNNDKDSIKLINKTNKETIDSCAYQINKENIYQEILCEEKNVNLEISTNNLDSNLVTQNSSQKTIDNSQIKTQIEKENQTIDVDPKIKLKENDIFISEVNANPEGTDKGFEWIELVNKGDDYKGIIQIKINEKLEEHFVNIKEDEYIILTPKSNLRNSDLSIELVKPMEENQTLIIAESREGESYSEINNEFQLTNMITKGIENPISKSIECEINKYNRNTNQISCGESIFTLNQTSEFKEGELVDIQYYEIEDKNLINEIIKKTEKTISIKNASFTILSLLSLVFMHRISF